MTSRVTGSHHRSLATFAVAGLLTSLMVAACSSASAPSAAAPSAAAPSAAAPSAAAPSAAAPSAAAPSAAASSAAASSALLAQIKKAGVIRVGIAIDPPFTLQKPDGTWYSFNPSLVTMLGQYMGVKIDFVASGWTGIVAGLQANQYDIIGASISATPERKKAIDFTIPYAYGGTTWFVLKNNPKHLSTLTDLNQKSVTIAFTTGTFQDQITHTTMPNATYRSLANASNANLIAELSAKRADAISLPSFLDAAIEQAYPDFQPIPNNTQGVAPTGVAWGINKGHPNFVAYLNGFIQEQISNGTVQKLMQQDLTVKNSLG